MQTLYCDYFHYFSYVNSCDYLYSKAHTHNCFFLFFIEYIRFLFLLPYSTLTIITISLLTYSFSNLLQFIIFSIFNNYKTETFFLPLFYSFVFTTWIDHDFKYFLQVLFKLLIAISYTNYNTDILIYRIEIRRKRYLVVWQA